LNNIRILAVLLPLALLSASSLEAQLEIANRYWLRDSATGHVLWLGGHGVTNLIGQLGIDIEEHNNHYNSFGANTLRLHLTQGALGRGAPWKLLPDGRYDLAAWNELWWDRLRLFMDDCKQRGIYPFVQIWDEPVIERGERRWKANPWRPSNNVNGLKRLSDNPDGHAMPGFYDVTDSKLMALQDEFVRRVLDATASYGICIYSICNEYDFGAKAPLAWQQHWIEFFGNYEKKHSSLPTPLLLTNTAVERYMDEGYGAFPVIDWYYLGRDFRMKHFGRAGEDVAGTSGSVLHSMAERARKLYPGKPLINSRPSSSPDRGVKDFTNEAETRRVLWSMFTSAVHVAGFRHLNPTGPDDKQPWLNVHPDCSQCSDGLATERALNSVHAFLRLVQPNLASFVPEFDSAAGIPVFRLKSDNEQILYLPEGGAAAVSLSPCCDEAWRYDPGNPDGGLTLVERGELAGEWLQAGSTETVFYLRRKDRPGSLR
jgi:hypothetical protein